MACNIMHSIEEIQSAITIIKNQEGVLHRERLEAFVCGMKRKFRRVLCMDTFGPTPLHPTIVEFQDLVASYTVY